MLVADLVAVDAKGLAAGADGAGAAGIYTCEISVYTRVNLGKYTCEISVYTRVRLVYIHV